MDINVYLYALHIYDNNFMMGYMHVKILLGETIEDLTLEKEIIYGD